jgi:hypothetical protein
MMAGKSYGGSPELPLLNFDSFQKAPEFIAWKRSICPCLSKPWDRNLILDLLSL